MRGRGPLGTRLATPSTIRARSVMRNSVVMAARSPPASSPPVVERTVNAPDRTPEGSFRKSVKAPSIDFSNRAVSKSIGELARLWPMRLTPCWNWSVSWSKLDTISPTAMAMTAAMTMTPTRKARKAAGPGPMPHRMRRERTPSRMAQAKTDTTTGTSTRFTYVAANTRTATAAPMTSRRHAHSDPTANQLGTRAWPSLLTTPSWPLRSTPTVIVGREGGGMLRGHTTEEADMPTETLDESVDAETPAESPGRRRPRRRRAAGRGDLDRRHVRRLLSAATRPAMDLAAPFELDPQVALRPEPFGMLAVPLRHEAAELPPVARHRRGRLRARRPTERRGGTRGLRHRTRALAELHPRTRNPRDVGDDPPAPSRRSAVSLDVSAPVGRITKTETLVDQMKAGLDAPICLTWELTYACNLPCVHCLCSSGRRDPRELTTAETWRSSTSSREMQVFYVNIGGGEPMLRPDFFEIVEYATATQVGVKFSTNGAPSTPRPHAGWRRWTTSTSRSRLDGATADQRRGPRRGLLRRGDRRAMDHLPRPTSGRSRSASS